MVRKNKNNMQATRDFVHFIHSASLLTELKHYARLKDFPDYSHHRENILAKCPPYGPKAERTWRDFLRQATNLSQNNRPALLIYQSLMDHLKNPNNCPIPRATHQAKRTFVKQIGASNHPPLSIIKIIEEAPDIDTAAATVLSELGLVLLMRNRILPCQYRRYKKIVELPSNNPEDIFVDESTGFYRIEADQSVVVVSYDKELDKYTMELLVIRNVPGDDLYAPYLLDWLEAVILTACRYRRNQRPNHAGQMVQIGLTMGARHATILGWGKSYRVQVDDRTRIAQDTDLIGALSIFWALVRSVFPVDITSEVDRLIEEDYPSLASRDIPPGDGYQIMIKDKIYEFKTAARAPPEGIATVGYGAHSHIDPAFLTWALTMTTSRRVPIFRQMRPDIGGNFTDLTLKIVVSSAAATMMAFKPEFLHGTSECEGAVNTGLSMTTTERVRKGYEAFINAGKPVVFGFQATDDHSHNV
ncbi:hypothetical protein C8J56DRAFT_1173958 [Mycena floridula]|nr:hypothetical protein C8J56DRAFT_1173958 [Mycena floridula]